MDPFPSYLSHNSFRQSVMADEASGSGVGEEYAFRCKFFKNWLFKKIYFFSGCLVRHFVLALSIFFTFVRLYVKKKKTLLS